MALSQILFYLLYQYLYSTTMKKSKIMNTIISKKENKKPRVIIGNDGSFIWVG